MPFLIFHSKHQHQDPSDDQCQLNHYDLKTKMFTKADRSLKKSEEF